MEIKIEKNVPLNKTHDEKSMKISKSDYLKIVGLLALGQGYARQAEECEKALREIVKEKEWGHCGDAIFNHSPHDTADDLLKRLDITVKK